MPEITRTALIRGRQLAMNGSSLIRRDTPVGADDGSVTVSGAGGLVADANRGAQLQVHGVQSPGGWSGIVAAIIGGTGSFRVRNVAGADLFMVGSTGVVTIGGAVSVQTLTLTGGATSPLLKVGGVTNAFPALRYNGVDLEVVRADNSAWSTIRANAFISTGSGNNLLDLTCGATNFTAGVTCTGGNITCNGSITAQGGITAIGAIISQGVMYPGRVDVAGSQTGWYLASHGGYGLWTNTGFYVTGGIWTGTHVACGTSMSVGTTLSVAGSTTLAFTNFQASQAYRPQLRWYSIARVDVAISGGGLTLNCEQGNMFVATWNQTITSLSIINWPAGKAAVELWLYQDAGGRVINLPWGPYRTPGFTGSITGGPSAGRFTILTFHTYDAGAGQGILVMVAGKDL